MITVITVVKNEETMLPFFFRHYERFADRFIVLDNGSTDKTPELIKAHPKATMHGIDTQGEFKDSMLTNVKNHLYRALGGNWFIIVDCDEFIWHHNLPEYLRQCDLDEVTLPKVKAFDMIGTAVPVDDGKSQLWELLDTGVRTKFYDKFAVVNQKVNINYRPGCHRCDPTGEVRYSRTADLMLLHFAWLSEEYRISRAEEIAKTMSAENKENGWSHHYLNIPSLRNYYQESLRFRQPVFEGITK